MQNSNSHSFILCLQVFDLFRERREPSANCAFDLSYATGYIMYNYYTLQSVNFDNSLEQRWSCKIVDY